MHEPRKQNIKLKWPYINELIEKHVVCTNLNGTSTFNIGCMLYWLNSGSRLHFSKYTLNFQLMVQYIDEKLYLSINTKVNEDDNPIDYGYPPSILG